jgi:hypothetical protein
LLAVAASEESETLETFLENKDTCDHASCRVDLLICRLSYDNVLPIKLLQNTKCAQRTKESKRKGRKGYLLMRASSASPALEF